MDVIRKADIRELIKDFEKISKRYSKDFMKKSSMAREKKKKRAMSLVLKWDIILRQQDCAI